MSSSQGMFRSMSPAFSLLTGSNKDGLSSKEKKYITSVEKLIATFDTSIVEWADHISFLSKLLKCLQLNPKTELTKHYVPSDVEISKCLSSSLSKNLPSGVHKKSLEVYDYIFSILDTELSNRINVWLPGLLPLMSYLSMGVKPQLIELFGNYIVKLPALTLKFILRPVLLSLLPSIDDETSDTFNDCLRMIDDLKNNTQDDSHFWNSIFLIIITSNDRRLGGLIWCQRRLPLFNFTEDNDTVKCCITPTPKLLTKAISKGLRDENLLVQRGFFDLLVKHLELKSYVLQKLSDKQDLKNLVMNLSACVLRRDMSLNRRLWNWLLGPDETEHSEDKLSRSEYFAQFGFESLSQGLYDMINGQVASMSGSEQRIESFRISLLIMDKWEIGQIMIPKILTPILTNCAKLSDNEEVLKYGNTFFDNVDCFNIWSTFLKLILDKNLPLCLFVLQNFDVEEEEMMIKHLPVILLALICIAQGDDEWYDLILMISNLIPQRAYLPIDHADRETIMKMDSTMILDKIKNYYLESEDSDQPMPFANSDLSFIILEQISHLATKRVDYIYQKSLTTDSVILKICELYSDVMDKIPQLNANQIYSNDQLLHCVFLIADHDNCLELTFGVGKIFNHIIRADIDIVDKVVFLQNFLRQLWYLLSSNLAIRYQVEIVKMIFQLEISMSSDYVEALITKFFLHEENIVDKLNKFNLLWIHSSNFQDYGLFLNRSVELIIDELQNSSNEPFIRNWIMLLITNGNINRFMKILISSSILRFEFLKGSTAKKTDDFAVYNYQLGNIIKFIKLDKKIIEMLKTEMIVIDNEQLIDIMNLNSWENIGSYKSLIVEVSFKLIQLPHPDTDCFLKSLDIIGLLIDGNELKLKEYFNTLLTLALNTENDLLKIELINLILQLLKTSKSKSVKIFKDDEINDDNLILQLLLDGLLKFSNSNVLVPLIKLLSESLNVFKDFIFNIILKISNTIMLKINEFFDNFQKYVNESVELISPDIDQSISLLMNGLEELLSVSHSYLLLYQLDHGDSATASNLDAGFFGSVIQGVLQLEQHQESNAGLLSKKTAVLLSFKNSVNSIYKIWLWSEVNSKLNLSNDGGKSIIYIATKYKYRSKKFLEFLYLIEPLEILESLISYNQLHESKLIFKMLHVLDGSRPNLTLPHLFESITTRCTGNEDKINKELNEVQMSKFLFHYFESLDKNIYEDLFNLFNGFLKTILLQPASYKQIYPNMLSVTVLFNLGLNNDLKKYKRDLNDTFVKLLSIIGNSKLGDLQDDFFRNIIYIVPYFKNMQFDQDKLTIAYNVLINNLQPFLLKNDFKNDLVGQNVLIVNEHCLLKSWKTLVNDVTIGDNYFFNTKSSNLVLYNTLVQKNFSNDFDKINDLLIRLAVNNSNFLNWNDYTEILNGKKLNLKKIIYLISCCPKNNYMNLVSEIINKIKELINDPDLKIVIYLLIRCLILKFNETYLGNLWIIIYTELFRLFSSVLENQQKVDTLLIFAGCKLLDVLVYLKPEEFQLTEWLFISDNENDLGSLIDQILQLDLSDDVKEDTETCPLLVDIKSIEDFSQLQTQFFAQLSKSNYRNIIQGKAQIHQDLLEQDIFNDLF